MSPSGRHQRSRWDCTLEPADDEGRFAVRLGMRMVSGLANAHAALSSLPGRTGLRFSRRSLAPRGRARLRRWSTSRGRRLRTGDGPCRREALWAIKALRDVPLPLFAAAARARRSPSPEIDEPAVALQPMTAGSEVVEDYGHVGLTLRQHPVAFLATIWRAGRIVTCTEAIRPRRALARSRRSGSRPPAARQRQGRHVHHARR